MQHIDEVMSATNQQEKINSLLKEYKFVHDVDTLGIVDSTLKYIERREKLLQSLNSATKELNLSEDITGEVEVLIKYDGYIARQEQQVESTEKLEKYKQMLEKLI